MKLSDFIWECYNNKELVREYNRLRGTSIGKQSAGIDRLIRRLRVANADYRSVEQ